MEGQGDLVSRLGFRVWGLGSGGLSNNGKESGNYYIV